MFTSLLTQPLSVASVLYAPWIISMCALASWSSSSPLRSLDCPEEDHLGLCAGGKRQHADFQITRLRHGWLKYSLTVTKPFWIILSWESFCCLFNEIQKGQNQITYKKTSTPQSKVTLTSNNLVIILNLLGYLLRIYSKTTFFPLKNQDFPRDAIILCMALIPGSHFCISYLQWIKTKI